MSRIPLLCNCCQNEIMGEFDTESGELIIRRVRRNEKHFLVLHVDKLRAKIENKDIVSKDF